MCRQSALMFVALLLPLLAQAQGDTLRHKTIGNVQVTGRRVGSFMGSSVSGVSVIDMQMMDLMPRILGNADPMHYAQLLPGVQTNSEYDAGLHIQGCDNQHNVTAIEGVPVYNAAHLLGFFSVFNATHFSSFTLHKGTSSALMPNRLGGMADMQMCDTLSHRLRGWVSVGPMSSQATVVVPTSAATQLTFSARAAYLNLLYGHWLKMDDEQMGYSFDDYNLSFRWHPDSRNEVWLDAYTGHDHVGYDDNLHQYDTNLRWQNQMAALHWNRLLAVGTLRQTAYVTHYANRFSLEEDNLHVLLPSHVTDYGYKVSLETSSWQAGADVVHHSLQPQKPDVTGFFNIPKAVVGRQEATEASVAADNTVPLVAGIAMKTGLRATVFHHGNATFWAVDPLLKLQRRQRWGVLSVGACTGHQYLFRTGFSDAGLPTEFWFAADSRFRPQSSAAVTLSYDHLLMGNAYRVELELYAKWLRHQVEYSGNIYDFLYNEYDLNRMLLTGQGHNYGLNLLIEKRKGRITGWVSYAYGRARRRFEQKGYAGWYPASHERPHELNAVATYRLRRHWSFGATFVYASGTPFTLPRQFYLVAGNIVSEFSRHNEFRVHPYLRLDVSASYDFNTRPGRRSGLNFSVYNVTDHNNDIFYRLKFHNDGFALRPFRFVLPVMPSLNYYYHF